MRFFPNSLGAPLEEANDCHAPAGSPTGGQFCTKNGRDPEGLVERLKARARGENRIPHEDSQPVTLTDEPRRTRFLLPDGTRITGSRRSEHNDLAFEALGGGVPSGAHPRLGRLEALMAAGVVRYVAGPFGAIQFVPPLTHKQARLIADDWNIEYGANDQLFIDAVPVKDGKLDWERSVSGRLQVPFEAEELLNWHHRRRTRESNSCHAPAGSPAGGQFCSKSDVTSTPEFKAWFRKSKVVDADGRPLVVYHGTNVDPSEFRVGTHFGTAQAANDRYEHMRSFDELVQRGGGAFRRPSSYQVMPVYLSIQNPLRIPDLADIEYDYGEEKTFRSFESEGDLMEVLYERDVITRDEFWDHQYANNTEIYALLERKGYDGIVYKNSVEDAGQDSWIAFHPRQVKSALANRAFSPRRKKITEVNHCHGKAPGHPCSTASSKRFVDQEGVTHVGKFVELYHGTNRRRADAIAEQGLRVGAVRQQTMQGDPESNRKYVWLAKRADSATRYSEMHAHPVVITFRIPVKLYEQLNPHGRYSGPDSVWVKSGIPAKYIHSITRTTRESNLHEFNSCHDPEGKFARKVGSGTCAPSLPFNEPVASRPPGLRGAFTEPGEDDKPRDKQLRQPTARHVRVPDATLTNAGDVEHIKETAPRLVGEVKRLLARGRNALPEFEGLARDISRAAGLRQSKDLDAITGENGNFFVVGPVKGLERSLVKVVNDYDGDVGRLHDVVRGSIVVNTLKDAERIMRAIPAHAEVLTIKDRVKKPLASGYRDINLRVRLPQSGMITEIQILLKPMLKAKSSQGHKLYAQWRSAKPGSPERTLLDKAMADLYGKAWREAT